MKSKTNPLIAFLAILTLTSLSCSLVSRALDSEDEVNPPTVAAATAVAPTKSIAEASPTLTIEPKEENLQPTSVPVKPTQPAKPDQPPVKSDQLVRQWATAAEATSEYGSSDWSAMQAAGEPDTFECGDYGTAWAAANSDSVESITLYYYDAPLLPTEINIVQSYNPSQVVMVEVLDPYGEFESVIYDATPKATDECPYTLSIPVTDIDYLVMGVRITVDQTVLGLGWNEIDAVELVGYPEIGYILSPPTTSGMLEAWEDIAAWPIFPSADHINYQDDSILSYTVSDSSRQEVLDFVLAELEKIGWQLDVDKDGNCHDTDRCMSKLAGLDYNASDNALWFLIHPDSSDAMLTLTLVESSGIVVVAMARQ